jgi:hypothetical protein
VDAGCSRGRLPRISVALVQSSLLPHDGAQRFVAHTDAGAQVMDTRVHTHTLSRTRTHAHTHIRRIVGRLTSVAAFSLSSASACCWRRLRPNTLVITSLSRGRRQSPWCSRACRHLCCVRGWGHSDRQACVKP